jgi:hypothetical protein
VRGVSSSRAGTATFTRRALLVLPLAVLAPVPLAAQTCEGLLTSTGRIPLSDLGALEYAPGHLGGLYPGGASARPAAHEAAGLAIALADIVPRDAAGSVAPGPADGRIGLVSIGMSNTTQEFSRYRARALSDPARNPRLTIVDGAQGGQAAEDWVGSAAPWDVLASRLAAAGLTRAQVQVVWMKQANRGPGALGDFEAHARRLQSDLEAILRRLKAEFPNLRLAYLSSRTRAYTDVRTGLNPEPFAYESGFSVRWTIADQLAQVEGMRHDAGEVPWLAWGPYLWVDGENPRSDGLLWHAADLNRDCTHPSDSGREKVADQLQAFFKADATTAPWYLSPAAPADAPRAEVTPASAEGPAPLALAFSVAATAAGGAAIAEHAWSFDDGTTSLSPSPEKTFRVPGSYTVRLTVSDTRGGTTRVAVPVTVTGSVPPEGHPFVRSDCNEDGETDISDPLRLLFALFVTFSAPPCEDACDANDDGLLDLGDAVATLNEVFLLGPLPDPPFPDCGGDTTADGLGCAGFRACGKGA